MSANEQNKKKQHILEAAISVFIENGFEETSYTPNSISC